jgi:hypothetical protein
MEFKTRAAFLVVLLAAGLFGCDRTITGPTSRPAAVSEPPAPPPGNPNPPFHVADVVLSGVVFETTNDGQIPIAGVDVLNGEGNSATTDANGFYSFGPVWVCPCAAQPWIQAGTTFVWVTKQGYADPPGTPGSAFGNFVPSPGTRDVKIDGNTRFDIELVRRSDPMSDIVPAARGGIAGVRRVDMKVSRSGTATVTLQWPDADYSLQLYVTSGICPDVTGLLAGMCTILGKTRPGDRPGVVASPVTNGDLNTIWVLNPDPAPQPFTIATTIE